MSRIVSFLKDEEGASAAEYALLLAIVTGGMVAAVSGLGKAIDNAINNAAGVING